MVYNWRDGSRKKGDAQKAGEILETIRLENSGFLNTRLVVAAAKPKSCYLHRFFEWNNRKAAEIYRRRQASDIISSIIVVCEERPELPVRAYVSLREGGESASVFTDIKTAMSDEKMRDIVLRNALFELDAFGKKYNALTELAEVFRASDRVKKRIQKRRKK